MRSPAWAGLCLLLAGAGPTRAQLVINEFLADPEGSDGGREFVELLNTGATSLDLGGWQLQFANGAEGPSWQVRWTGLAGVQLAPGARFLIVDRNWAGGVPGDAEVALALQNGPDAIRLIHGSQAMDVVGYGALTDAAMMEAAPAPVAAGKSTARRPDGHDTANNANDFVTALPTPGGANFERFLLTPVTVGIEPPSLPRAGDAVTVDVVLRNDGLEPLPITRVLLGRAGDAVETTLDGMATGESRRLVLNIRPAAPGLVPLELRLLPPGAVDSLRIALADFQVGPAALCLNEVLAAPRDGQGEWVEFQATGPDTVDLGAFRLRDADGGWVRLPSARLPHGALALVAQDSLLLGGWLAANAAGPAVARGCGAVARQPTNWPSLNNSVPDGRDFADRLLLADSTGAVIDHVTLPAATGELAGRSLERAATIGAAWVPSLSTAGSTPGCPNSISAPVDAPAPASGLAASPAVADRAAGAGAVHLLFVVPEAASGWDLAVFDLDGRRVRDLGGERSGPGPRDVMWDLGDDHGTPVPAGGYVAVLRLAARGPGAGGPSRVLVGVR